MKPIILCKDYKYYRIEQDRFMKLTMGEKLYYDMTKKFKKSIVTFSSFKQLCLDFLFGTSKTNNVLNQIRDFCIYKDKYTLLSKENKDLVYNNTKVQIYDHTKDYIILGCDNVKIKVYKKIKTLITIGDYTLVINKKYLKDE